MFALPGFAARRAMPSAGLAGVLAGLGQAPVSLPWATLLGLGFLYMLFAAAERTKGAAWLGWAGGTGYFAATLFWIIEPFFVDLARHGWMAPFALAGLAGGLALFWAVAFGLAHRLGQGVWSRALAWAVLLAIAELARSYVLTGFPWALIGHVWIGWAPMHLAAFVGPVGLTLLTLLVPALVLAAGHGARGRGVVMLAPFALLYGFGLWQGAQPVPQAEAATTVRLLQPNAAQHLKWDPDTAPIFFDRLVEMTAAPAETRPDLIIWPETSVPVLLERAGVALDRMVTAANGTPVVFGIQRSDLLRFYNSLVVLDTAGEITEVYDKHHLVPFGEYVPAPWLFSRVGLDAFTADQGFGYSAGPGARLIDLGPLGRALPLICYEAIFPQDLHAAPERPDWLLQITNDAWFGQISGPYQHLAQARLRAVEMGLPMVRVANTGVSAVIDARGRVRESLPLNTSGFLDAALPSALPATLYARTGDAPVAIVLFLSVLGLFAGRLRNRD